jgi:hypothetical protein
MCGPCGCVAMVAADVSSADVSSNKLLLLELSDGSSSSVPLHVMCKNMHDKEYTMHSLFIIFMTIFTALFFFPEKYCNLLYLKKCFQTTIGH